MSEARSRERMFTGSPCVQESLCAYAERPIAFFARYVRLRPVAHAVILSSVGLAVLCSVVTQYGVKFLVDTLSQPVHSATGVWLAFGFWSPSSPRTISCGGWRAWVGNSTFVAVTGDVRRDFSAISPACTELLRQPFPRHAHQPHHGDIQCFFTVENMLVVERASALHRHGLRDRVRGHRKLGHGGQA